MLTPAGVLAKVGGREEVGVNEIEECEGLFLDAGRSARSMGEGETNGYLS